MKEILVIDDDSMALQLLVAFLENDDYAVTALSSGEAGIELASKKTFHLAIVDMVMPSKDGLQTILELRQVQADLPVIAISGGGVIPKERYLAVAGCLSDVETLPKPFQQRELLSCVERLIL